MLNRRQLKAINDVMGHFGLGLRPSSNSFTATTQPYTQPYIPWTNNGHQQ